MKPVLFGRSQCEPGCDPTVIGGRVLITVSRGTISRSYSRSMSPLVVVIDGDLDPAARLVSVVPAAWRLRAPGSLALGRGRLGAGLVVGGTLGADADVAAADEVEVALR